MPDKTLSESWSTYLAVLQPLTTAALAIIFDWAASHRGLEYTLVSKASVTEKLKISLAPMRHGGKSALAAIALLLIVATQTPVALNRAYNPVFTVPAGSSFTKEVRVSDANTMRAFEVDTGTPCEVILRRFDIQNATCDEQQTKTPEDYWVYVEATNEMTATGKTGSQHQLIDLMGVDNNQTRDYNASVRTGDWYMSDYTGYDLMESWKIASVSENKALQLMSPSMSLYPENNRDNGGHQLCEEVTTQTANQSNDTILVYRSARVWMKYARTHEEALADLKSVNVDDKTMALLRNDNGTGRGMSVMIGDNVDGFFELTAFSASKRGPTSLEYVTRALSLRIAITKLGTAQNTNKINWYKKTVEEDGQVSFEMPASRDKGVDPVELYRYLRTRNWNADGTTLPLTIRHTESRIKAAIIVPMITLQLLVLLLAAIAVVMTPPVFAQSIAQTIYETTAVRTGSLAKRSWVARFSRAEPVVEGGIRLLDAHVVFKDVALRGMATSGHGDLDRLVSSSYRPKDDGDASYSKLSTSERTETDDLGSMRLHGSFDWEPRPRT